MPDGPHNSDTVETPPVLDIHAGDDHVAVRRFHAATDQFPNHQRPFRSLVAKIVGAMAGIGTVSGVLFGGTNVGVQLVAYVRSFDLSHSLFVGVVALVFLGLNAVRIVAAVGLCMYPSSTVALASVGAAVPSAVGVALGVRLRSRLSEGIRRTAVRGLLSIVGVRLILGGAGIL